MNWCWASFDNVLQDLTLQEAETIALSILKQVMEEKVKNDNTVQILVYMLFSSFVCSL